MLQKPKYLVRTGKNNSKEIDRTANTINSEFERTEKFLTPTETVCFELQGAYSYFNRVLFSGELPECMLTIDQSGRTILGYFKPYSFQSSNGAIIHQISMNPYYILQHDIRDVLSTLVHEQCHLWTHEFTNRKTSNGYHCKKWAGKMNDVGLAPTDDGTINGNQTGFRVTHLIQKGGKFDLACTALLDRGFQLSWGMALLRMGDDEADLTGNGNGEKASPSQKKDRSKGKVKFICPDCNAPCWAAPSRHLICGDHMKKMVRVAR